MYDSRMDAAQIESIEKMSTEQKLKLMELLWSDLSAQPSNIPIPKWHSDVLSERLASVKSGRTDFVEWSDVKRKLKERP